MTKHESVGQTGLEDLLRSLERSAPPFIAWIAHDILRRGGRSHWERDFGRESTLVHVITRYLIWVLSRSSGKPLVAQTTVAEDLKDLSSLPYGLGRAARLLAVGDEALAETSRRLGLPLDAEHLAAFQESLQCWWERVRHSRTHARPPGECCEEDHLLLMLRAALGALTAMRLLVVVGNDAGLRPGDPRTLLVDVYRGARVSRRETWAVKDTSELAHLQRGVPYLWWSRAEARTGCLLLLYPAALMARRADRVDVYDGAYLEPCLLAAPEGADLASRLSAHGSAVIATGSLIEPGVGLDCAVRLRLPSTWGDLAPALHEVAGSGLVNVELTESPNFLQLELLGPDWRDATDENLRPVAGAFGTVYPCTHVKYPDRLFAVKVFHDHVDLHPSWRDGLDRVERASSGSPGDSVVHYYPDLSRMEFGKRPAYVVMDWRRSRGNLDDVDARGLIGRTPTERLAFSTKLVEAVAWLHRLNAPHRDLHPSNVLVCEAKDGMAAPVLVDLGLALIQQGGSSTSAMTGTLLGAGRRPFVAPESALVEHDPFRADVHGLGWLCVMVLAGRAPMELELAPDRALKPVQRMCKHGALPAALSDLLDQWVASDPMERPESAVEALDQWMRIARGQARAGARLPGGFELMQSAGGDARPYAVCVHARDREAALVVPVPSDHMGARTLLDRWREGRLGVPHLAPLVAVASDRSQALVRAPAVRAMVLDASTLPSSARARAALLASLLEVCVGLARCEVRAWVHRDGLLVDTSGALHVVALRPGTCPSEEREISWVERLCDALLKEARDDHVDVGWPDAVGVRIFGDQGDAIESTASPVVRALGLLGRREDRDIGDVMALGVECFHALAPALHGKRPIIELADDLVIRLLRSASSALPTPEVISSDDVRTESDIIRERLPTLREEHWREHQHEVDHKRREHEEERELRRVEHEEEQERRRVEYEEEQERRRGEQQLERERSRVERFEGDPAQLELEPCEPPPFEVRPFENVPFQEPVREAFASWAFRRMDPTSPETCARWELNHRGDCLELMARPTKVRIYSGPRALVEIDPGGTALRSMAPASPLSEVLQRLPRWIDESFVPDAPGIDAESLRLRVEVLQVLRALTWLCVTLDLADDQVGAMGAVRIWQDRGVGQWQVWSQAMPEWFEKRPAGPSADWNIKLHEALVCVWASCRLTGATDDPGAARAHLSCWLELILERLSGIALPSPVARRGIGAHEERADLKSRLIALGLAIHLAEGGFAWFHGAASIDRPEVLYAVPPTCIVEARSVR